MGIPITQNPMSLSIQHLDRLPAAAREPVGKYAGALAASLGDDLLTLAVYGSAAGSDFAPGRSDVNLLAVVRRLDLAALRRVRAVPSPRRGPRIPSPLMLTPSYIANSLDAFPVEFLEIKECHLLLAGEDLLSGIQVRPEHLRLQCERELKAHLLRLRQAYLERGAKGAELDRLLHEALNALMPVLRQLPRLRAAAGSGAGARPARAEAIAQLAGLSGVDSAPLAAIERRRTAGARAGPEEAERDLGELIALLEALTLQVDRWH